MNSKDNDEPSLDWHVGELLEENKELKRKLEDMVFFNHVEIVETKRKPKKPEKKPEKKCSTDQIEIEKLKAHASSYSNCIWSHCQDASNSREVNMLYNHAKYVTFYAEECWQFLKVRGVLRVDSKHCQYFFSICWPIYKPWQELNRHVLDKLLEDGTLKNIDIPENPWGNTRPFFNAVKEQKP